MDERRKHPRLEKKLPIKLKQFPGKDFDISTETKNISANGAYCTVNRPIELMTKLELTLLLPLPNVKVKKIKKIKCRGIVVRTEKNKENKMHPYRVAIFFHDIDSQDKKTLHSYVNSLS